MLRNSAGYTMPQNPRLESFRLADLRKALRDNRVSFPAQVPTFDKHDRPDLQCKIVNLYFVMGWSCGRIAERHRMARQRIQQILNTWKRRAVEMGYVQNIPPAESLIQPAAAHPAAPVPKMPRLPVFLPVERPVELPRSL